MKALKAASPIAFLTSGVDLVRQVLDLAGGHDVGELAAAAGHEDVGHVTRVDGGLQLAVHVLVLDRGDLDRHVGGVGLVERLGRVGPELLAVARGRVLPQGQRLLAALVAAAGASGAAGEGDRPPTAASATAAVSTLRIFMLCFSSSSSSSTAADNLLSATANVPWTYSDTAIPRMSNDIDNVFHR